MTRYELRAVQMQKFMNPQVTDSYGDNGVLNKYPLFFGKRRISLYKQYVRPDYNFFATRYVSF